MARPKILVVDDEPGMLRTIERILSTRYDVRAVRLPSAALDAAAAGSFDVAILDVRMPEMDGFALMARLGERQPDLDVIMMTGSTDERDARLIRAIREKAFFFLTKPFDREVLLTLVQRCLEARRLSRENRAHVARLECELRAAQVFQQSLLPDRTASSNGFDVSFLYEPCDELGGDFCDYVLRDEAAGRHAGLGRVGPRRSVRDDHRHGQAGVSRGGAGGLCSHSRSGTDRRREPPVSGRQVRHRDCRAFQAGVKGDRICQRRTSAGTASGSRRVGRTARTVGADDSPRTARMVLRTAGRFEWRAATSFCSTRMD